jgi:hypothetical protein
MAIRRSGAKVKPENKPIWRNMLTNSIQDGQIYLAIAEVDELHRSYSVIVDAIVSNPRCCSSHIDLIIDHYVCT